MFRHLNGFKALYGDLTLLAVSEFDDWRVLVYGPQTTIHGTRQTSELKAKEHALNIAQAYLKDIAHVPPPAEEVNWNPADHDDWLVWRS